MGEGGSQGLYYSRRRFSRPSAVVLPKWRNAVFGNEYNSFFPTIFCETYVHIPGGAKVAVACVGRGRGSICIIVLGAYVTPKAE